MDETNWSVYVHTNKLNGKKYVGITSQPVHKRWLSGYGYDNRLKFGRAIGKYGWDGFTHEVVCIGLSEEDAKNVERKLINDLQTQDDRYGYNMTCGGDGLSGYKHTELSKQKMSSSKSGSNHPNYHKHLSDATRNRIAGRLFGNKNASGAVRSNETKSKMSNAKKKPVEMYADNVLIRVFDSAIDAQTDTGVNRKNISQCCLGKRKYAGGYTWKFA